MRYVDASSGYCNTTVQPYVYNLTSSYTGQSNEGIMAVTPAAMLLLAAFFFNLNLFSRFSDVSAFLHPSIRIFLKVSLSLFLPVMSYLFSEAKDNVATTGEMDELSLRARTILTWMLLVELLNKKVEAILSTSTSGGMEGYSGIIERIARIAWLGYLVFFDLRSIGKKALYGTLWILAAAKLVQRFITSELGKRSFAYGRNPQLLASYMAQILQEPHPNSGSEPLLKLKQCRYPVMGEEYMKMKHISQGYHFEIKEAQVTTEADEDNVVVTVGSIWRLVDEDKNSQLERRSHVWRLAIKKPSSVLERDPPLKRLCFSFALYKLLRRRLEGFPITGDEASNCHNLIFEGLLCDEDLEEEDSKAIALFKVLNDEVQFLCEYYHSIHPVVFASPFFFLMNYIMCPIIVWASCILMVILCNNGDVMYAFHSFRRDNYPMTVGLLKLIGCLLSRITVSPQDLFATVDISVTILLVLAFVYEEVWEFIVFLLSNWFMVSLLCSYTSKPQWRTGKIMRKLIHRILWVRKKLSRPNVCFKQFSVLWLSSLPLPTKAVPIGAKVSIMRRLKNARNVAPSSNCISSTLRSNNDEHLSRQLQWDQLSWACEGDGIAEVILTWHVATAVLEAAHPLQKQARPESNRKAATALSGYCAYLVAFHPELLPGEKDAMVCMYKDMKSELKKKIGCWGYYFCRQGKLVEFVKKLERESESESKSFFVRKESGSDSEKTKALTKGIRLGKILIDEYDKAATDEAARASVWKLLTDLWTEVVVCASATPAISEMLHVKAHKKALAHGGEFITLLWALVTHTGIVTHCHERV